MARDEYGDWIQDPQGSYGNAQALQDQLDPNRGSGQPTSSATDNGPAPPPPSSPSGGASLSPLQQVQNEYQKDFGRAPTGGANGELASEMDNLNRYAWDTGKYGGVKAQIDKRMTNAPNDGRPSNPTNQQQQYQQYQQATGGQQPQGSDALSAFLAYLQQKDAAGSAQQASLRDILMSQLGSLQQPVNATDPGINAVLQGQRLESQRAAERQKAQAAEKYASQGLGHSGAFDVAQQGIEQQRGEADTKQTGQVMYQELARRGQQLSQLLSLAVQSGDANSARNIQSQLQAIQSQLQNQQYYSGLNQNQNQFNDRMGLDWSQFNAGQNGSGLGAILQQVLGL